MNYECPRPCCRPQWRVKLISADGLESVKDTVVADVRPFYETVLAEPVAYSPREDIIPVGPAFRTRRYELFDRDVASMTLTYREKVDPPPKPPVPSCARCGARVGRSLCVGCS